jgi:hypothetical protein
MRFDFLKMLNIMITVSWDSPCVVWYVGAYVLEEHIASVNRVEVLVHIY